MHPSELCKHANYLHKLRLFTQIVIIYTNCGITTTQPIRGVGGKYKRENARLPPPPPEARQSFLGIDKKREVSGEVEY